MFEFLALILLAYIAIQLSDIVHELSDFNDKFE